MTKKDLKLLERIFEREISGTDPLQSTNARYPILEEMGYVTQATRHFKPDRFGPITITGWILTHAGRIAYCESCNGSLNSKETK